MSKKGRIAKKKLDGIGNNICCLTTKLKEVKEELGYIIESDKDPKLEKVEKTPEEIEAEKITNNKTLLLDKVVRIEFKEAILNFYIEFTIVSRDNDEFVEHEGRIIYGVNRTLCYKNCIIYNCHKDCERLDRCDGLKDKPLAQFSIDRYGRMQSKNNIEGEWWVGVNEKDLENGEPINKKDLYEMHYLTLVHIWKDALSWVNENILP